MATTTTTESTTTTLPKVDFERLVREVSDGGQKLWLAGLGAFGRLSENGSELFEELVEKGEKVEKPLRRNLGRFVDRRNEELRALPGKLEGRIEERVEKALHRFGVPTHQDFEELNAKLDQLEALLEKTRG